MRARMRSITVAYLGFEGDSNSRERTRKCVRNIFVTSRPLISQHVGGKRKEASMSELDHGAGLHS